MCPQFLVALDGMAEGMMVVMWVVMYDAAHARAGMIRSNSVPVVGLRSLSWKA